MVVKAMIMAVRFNRPISKDEDYISPGGYEMTMGDKIVNFDFYEHYGYINKTDKSVCEFDMYDIDDESFPEFSEVTIEDVKNISHISECFVYTGEEGESDLKPIEIISISFALNDNTAVNVPQNIIDEYNRTLKKTVYTWKDVVCINGVFFAEEFEISGEMDDTHYDISNFISAVAEKHGVDTDDVQTYMMDDIDFDPQSLPYGAESCGCYIDGTAEWLRED